LTRKTTGAQTYNSRGEFLHTWGGDGAGILQFLEPSDIAYDQNAGWLYMVDTGTDRIQWMDVRGRVRGLKGSTGTGDEQFNNPTALAVDAVNG